MDYIAELFGHMTAEEVAKSQANVEYQQALRQSSSKAESAVSCPKCAGSGRISSFSHIKGGACFSCGGSGVFSRYKG